MALWTTFNTGVPASSPMIEVDGYGLCQFRLHYENGDVLLYMGSNRMFRIPGSNRWRYVERR